MASEVYIAYLKSDDWAEKRKEAFALYSRKCDRCGCTKNLHVHHKTYASIYHELMEHLQILCSECHGAVHGKKRRKPNRKAKKPKQKTKKQRKRARDGKARVDAEMKRVQGLHKR